MKVGESPPLPGQECHLAFGVLELPLHGRRRCFRGYLTLLDRAFCTWLLALSAAGRGAQRGTMNICRPCGKIQTLLKDSLQVAAEGGGTRAYGCGHRVVAQETGSDGLIGKGPAVHRRAAQAATVEDYQCPMEMPPSTGTTAPVM